MSTGNFRQSLSQAILVGIILAGRLGVRRPRSAHQSRRPAARHLAADGIKIPCQRASAGLKTLELHWERRRNLMIVILIHWIISITAPGASSRRQGAGAVLARRSGHRLEMLLARHAGVCEKTRLWMRRLVGKSAFKRPNQGLDCSFCCLTAGQGLAQKEYFFTDTGDTHFCLSTPQAPHGAHRRRVRAGNIANPPRSLWIISGFFVTAL